MNQFRFFSKGLVLLFLIVSSLSISQTIDTNYKTQINAKLSGLDKTKIPHKLLLNQAMEFAELSDYSGFLTTTNWATRGKYEAVYNTLLMSRVQTSIAGLVSPPLFKSNWDNLRAPNRIVLSGLYYKYSKFRSDAYPNFLVNNNGVVTDKYVNGIWQNPYTEQQVFAIATPILVYKSLSLEVTLPSSLWYTNQATSLQSIAIDFGNGLGYQSTSFGQIHTISYTTSGVFEWKYKLTLTDGQTLFGHSKLKIDVPVLENPPTNPNLSSQSTQSLQPNVAPTRANPGGNSPAQNCASVAVMQFYGTRQYLGSSNSATLQIKYRNNDCVIRKPLIVAEGFDSGLLGVENPFGEVSYDNFIRSTFSSFNLYFKTIDYDIIYINFRNGRDDIKRNAYLVEDIINWVNTQKANAGSTTPNVVIGQSMGGIVARYALRDMEMLGQTHQSSLFVSHDAPQQGANIPVGIQYYARHMADQFIDTPLGDMQISTGQGSNISIEDIRNLFDAQGTKQLLTTYIDSNSNLNNTDFNTFQAELRNMGYPNQTRNIALSNGNHCANPQEFNPSALLFSLNGGASTTALSTFLSILLQPLTGIGFAYLAYEFNEPGLLLGLLPGSSSFSMDFYANALPVAGTLNQVYHGGIQYTKVLFDLFGWRPTITVSLTDRIHNNPVALSYDYYPGGKYQLPFDFQNTALHNDFINASISSYLAPSFNFIPVPSALDIGGGTTLLNNTDYLRKYNAATPPLAPKNSPFANFTTSFPNNTNMNEVHISFNTRNGNWLATELDNDTNNNQVFDCSFICNDYQIAGPSILCSNSIFSVPTAPTNFNWTISQGSSLATISGNGTSNITLIPYPNVSGQIVLSLTIGDDGATCGNVTLTKTIWVGIPIYNNFELIGNQSGYNPLEPNISYGDGEGGCNSIRRKINFDSPSILEFQWEKLSTSQINLPASSPTGYLELTPQCNELLTFRVRARNICGWSEWKQFDMSLSRCTMSCESQIPPTLVGANFILNPNPVTDGLLNVSVRNDSPWFSYIIPGGLTDSDGNPVRALVQRIRVNIAVFNNSGTQVLTFNNSPMPIQLNLSNLPQGTYVVVLEHQGQFESYTIIKN